MPLHPLASTAGVKVTPHFAMLSMLLVVHDDITMDGLFIYSKLEVKQFNCYYDIAKT